MIYNVQEAPMFVVGLIVWLESHPYRLWSYNGPSTEEANLTNMIPQYQWYNKTKTKTCIFMGQPVHIYAKPHRWLNQQLKWSNITVANQGSALYTRLHVMYNISRTPNKAHWDIVVRHTDSIWHVVCKYKWFWDNYMVRISIRCDSIWGKIS